MNVSQPGDVEPGRDLPLRRAYDVLGLTVLVASDSEEYVDTLDRLNAEFQIASEAAPGSAGAVYEAVLHRDADVWELTFQGEELAWYEGLLRAVSYVEWHICDQA